MKRSFQNDLIRYDNGIKCFYLKKFTDDFGQDGCA